MTSVLAVLGVMLAATFGAIPVAAETEVRDLGTLPDHFTSSANGINSAGQVVGNSLNATTFLDDAFLWDEAGGMRQLPPLAGQRSAIAEGINDAGHVVGQSGDFGVVHAVLWVGNVASPLAALPGHGNSSASDINATGSIVGVSFEQGLFDSRAVLWQEGAIVPLGGLGSSGVGIASGLNDRGQIVGASEVDAGGLRAFLWENGVMSDLGTLGGDSESAAVDVNNTGVVVGVSVNVEKFEFHAFAWTEGAGMMALGSLPGYNQSVATGINNLGQIVGWSFRGPFDGMTPPRAFVWSAGVMTPLPTLPDGAGSYAWGINDASAIVGQGIPSNPFEKFPTAVLWTPSAAPPPPLTAALSASPEMTDVGLTVTFHCTPGGGVPPYVYEWSFETGGPAQPGGAQATHAYTTPGSKTATCKVTDDVGKQTNATKVVHVFQLPTTTANVNHTATSPGMPLRFTAEATEGTGGYSYSWTFGDDSEAVTGDAVEHAYDSPGQYTAEVTVRDSAGGTGTRTVTVNVDYLVVTPGSVATSAETGEAVSFTATATGGAGDYAYHWDFGDDQSADGQTVSHAYQEAGTYIPKVTVTDAQGVRNVTTLEAITVGPRQDLGILGIPIPYLIVAIVVIVAAAAAGVAIGRRKRRRT